MSKALKVLWGKSGINPGTIRLFPEVFILQYSLSHSVNHLPASPSKIHPPSLSPSSPSLNSPKSYSFFFIYISSSFPPPYHCFSGINHEGLPYEPNQRAFTFIYTPPPSILRHASLDELTPTAMEWFMVYYSFKYSKVLISLRFMYAFIYLCCI